MANTYHDRSVGVKREWLDGAVLGSTEDDALPKDEPSCDVTLKVFDEPYIPPVYSKDGRSGGVPEIEGSPDDISSTNEADEYQHHEYRRESTDLFGVENPRLEQIGVAGRSKEGVVNNKVEPNGEGGEDAYDDTSLEEMCQYSEVTHIKCEYKGDGDGSNNFVAHNVGNEARPFACHMCNYCSSSSYHLKRHVLGHSGEKPFVCSYCDYKSHRADKVKRHARTHTGEKPFGCSYCNYKASRADHLKAHVRSHVMKGLGKNFSRIMDSN